MLTIQFVPYAEIEGLPTAKKISKLLSIVRDNKVVLMEGRLEKREETELIKKTMQQINNHFKGIEVSVVYPEEKTSDILKKMKSSIAGLLLGNRQGLTVIGPATIIKEIKKEKPESLRLMTENNKRNKKRGNNNK